MEFTEIYKVMASKSLETYNIKHGHFDEVLYQILIFKS